MMRQPKPNSCRKFDSAACITASSRLLVTKFLHKRRRRFSKASSPSFLYLKRRKKKSIKVISHYLPRRLHVDFYLDNTTWNRGYENLGSQILEAGTNPDQKEGFYVGEEITTAHPYFIGKKLNSGPNQWPEGFSEANLFRKASMEYYDHMHALARDVLSVIAQTLGLDADYFNNGFTKGAVATLRYLHYPPQPKDSDEKLSRGIGAHTDFGSVTLLMQDEVDGLQVWEKTTEEWLDVSSTIDPQKSAHGSFVSTGYLWTQVR